MGIIFINFILVLLFRRRFAERFDRNEVVVFIETNTSFPSPFSLAPVGKKPITPVYGSFPHARVIPRCALAPLLLDVVRAYQVRTYYFFIIISTMDQLNILIPQQIKALK